MACSWQYCSICRWSTTQVQYQPVQKVQQKKVAKKFAKESSSIASRVSFHSTIHVEPIYTCECSMLPANLTCHIDLLTTDVFYLCKFCRLLKTCWEQQYSLHIYSCYNYIVFSLSWQYIFIDFSCTNIHCDCTLDSLDSCRRYQNEPIWQNIEFRLIANCLHHTFHKRNQ